MHLPNDSWSLHYWRATYKEALPSVLLRETKHLGSGERPTLRFFATLKNDNAKTLPNDC